MPLIDNGSLYRRYDEDIHDDMRLGRHLWLDSRSLAYTVETSAAAWPPLKSQHWERIIPILNQGQLGSCPGNAGAGALGTQPFYDKCGHRAFGTNSTATDLEAFAVALYSAATTVDPYPGTWPPTDTGSSGLAICQVLKTRSTIKGYQWAVTAHGFAQLLQWGPVLLGAPWYEAFFTPAGSGFIDTDPNWAASGLAGGHEIEAVGIDLDTKDLLNSVITFCNSWGSSWADAGRFRMKLRTYTMLSGCDLKQFVV